MSDLSSFAFTILERVTANADQSCVRQLVTVSLVFLREIVAGLTSRREGDCLWTEFPNLGPGNIVLSRRTRPKPDLTYAFPIIKSPLVKLRGFERDEFSKGFTTHSLGSLLQKEIICTPTTGLRKWIKSPHRTTLSSPDLACFPWAVVEFKKDSEIEDERCYCQAANASAAALDLRTQLMEKVGNNPALDLPPVIAFTTVGHIVKVWLTYLEVAQPDHSSTRVRVRQSPNVNITF